MFHTQHDNRNPKANISAQPEAGLTQSRWSRLLSSSSSGTVREGQLPVQQPQPVWPEPPRLERKNRFQT
jgi:hypothetical protein